MIGSIRGTVLAKRPPSLLVDVGGVGYEVEAPMSTFYHLPDVGEAVHLHTHLVVREDAQLLFGFASEPERTAFRQLIKVNGVGARLAVTILSGIEVSDLARCVEEEDLEQLVRLPGIGKKTAERLVLDLRDRLGEALGGFSVALQPNAPVKAGEDALHALLALGYREKEAAAALREAADAVAGTSTEELIRAALQRLVKL